MEEFYKAWFKLHQKVPSASDEPSGSQDSSQSDKSDSAKEVEKRKIEKKPTQIVFETDSLKLIVEKSFFKRQKNFKLDDHLFHIKIVAKVSNEPPLLTDILDFLHEGLIHILNEMKKLYSEGTFENTNLTFLPSPEG